MDPCTSGADLLRLLGPKPQAPAASSAGVRAVMMGNRGRDTRPEQQVRSRLHRAGLRFRKHTRPLQWLRCQADIVFSRERVAVFIDGCFWHGCPQHGHVPRRNTPYWTDKLARNTARDQRNSEALTGEGWLVLRYWEHEPVEDVAQRVAEAVLRRRSPHLER